ncbi:MAG: GntR family transcriptional regulator [Olegusella sp.]|nr:GntR family transcriptional regulator [Olegusella sp.]
MTALETIAQTPLDPESPTPLYQQLEQRLLQLIASGALDAQTPLPTEFELCRAFDLSRATVRRCFSDLVASGAVVRRRGKGTFVSPNRIHRGFDGILNFSTEEAERGHTPSSKVLSLTKTTSNGGISRCLGVPDGTAVWEIRRVRLSDGKPRHLATAFVPVELCPELTRADVEKSLYARITEETGALPVRSEEVYEAVLLDKAEARALGSQPGQPAMRVLRTTFDSYGRCFEACVLVGPGSVNRFSVVTTAEGSVFHHINN